MNISNLKRHFLKAAAIAAVLFAASVQVAEAKQYVELNDYQKKWGFSPVISTKAGEIAWVGGHTATEDDQGKDISYDAKAQFRQVLKNIDKDLRRMGGSANDLVSITVYVNDPRMNENFTPVMKEFFKDGKYPGSSLLTISNFARPGIVVEVQGTAVINDELQRPAAR